MSNVVPVPVPCPCPSCPYTIRAFGSSSRNFPWQRGSDLSRPRWSVFGFPRGSGRRSNRCCGRNGEQASQPTMIASSSKRCCGGAGRVFPCHGARDLPLDFGPWKTVFNRFDRWAKTVKWERLFLALQTARWSTMDVDARVSWSHRWLRPRDSVSITGGSSRGYNPRKTRSTRCGSRCVKNLRT
jgi:hypothetical protein